MKALIYQFIIIHPGLLSQCPPSAYSEQSSRLSRHCSVGVIPLSWQCVIMIEVEYDCRKKRYHEEYSVKSVYYNWPECYICWYWERLRPCKITIPQMLRNTVSVQYQRGSSASKVDCSQWCRSFRKWLHTCRFWRSPFSIRIPSNSHFFLINHIGRSTDELHSSMTATSASSMLYVVKWICTRFHVITIRRDYQSLQKQIITCQSVAC